MDVSVGVGTPGIPSNKSQDQSQDQGQGMAQNDGRGDGHGTAGCSCKEPLCVRCAWCVKCSCTCHSEYQMRSRFMGAAEAAELSKCLEGT